MGQTVTLVKQGGNPTFASLAVNGSTNLSGSLYTRSNLNVSGSTFVSGSLVVSGSIVAQTLVVSTTTYSSGSNVFGNSPSNTQVFTGSMYLTGSAIFSNSLSIGPTTGTTGTAGTTRLGVVGAVTIGENTNGTAVIDAYSSFAYYGCNTAANGMAIGPTGAATFSSSIYLINATTRISGDGNGEVGINYGTTTTSTYGFSLYNNTTRTIGFTPSGSATFSSTLFINGAPITYGALAVQATAVGTARGLNVFSSASTPTGGNAITLTHTGTAAVIGADYTNAGGAYTPLILQTSNLDRLTIAPTGAATFSGSVTASSFSGAGTGLTGTAASLSIGGNAATATTAGNITAYTIDQSVGTSNSPSFNQVLATNNGNGTNFKVGDDAWLGDVNAANTVRLKGIQDATAGYLTFGNQTTQLGLTNSTTLTWGAAFTATGDITAYSDRRVKENIKTIDNALAKVLCLRGVTYNRTDLDDKSEKIGVIAQEIQEILPQVVSEENDRYSVAYGNITGVLIEAIKEQQKQIEELKSIINGITR